MNTRFLPNCIGYTCNAEGVDIRPEMWETVQGGYGPNCPGDDDWTCLEPISPSESLWIFPLLSVFESLS